MNKSDSERIATVLENIGYKPASRISEADLIVVNMCSVRQSAVDRVYGKIKNFVNLKTQNSKLKTLLTGCLLKSDFNKLKGKVDYILPIKTLKLWPEFLKKGKYFYYPDPRNPEFNEKFNINYLKTKSKNSNKFSAFIPISNGCNNFCTYCVVPFTRGPLICRSHKEILKEVKEVVKKGYKEIWLLGQNVNDYQSPTDTSVNFPKLLRQVNNIPGNFWIRFTSPHPKDFSGKLIETVAKSEKVAKYLHLPVQSGDNEILKRMGRPYTIEQYKNLIKKIREKVPKINLSTDVIVGFPGETKKQFENTVKLFKEIEFNMAYIAKYSPRPGTAAFQLKNNIPLEEKKKREKILRNLLKKWKEKN
jgi:tRNA-2-methylthio-N6-dimethylallyladenosine synthase